MQKQNYMGGAFEKIEESLVKAYLYSFRNKKQTY